MVGTFGRRVRPPVGDTEQDNCERSWRPSDEDLCETYPHLIRRALVMRQEQMDPAEDSVAYP
jgi:hypothetical protein